MTYWTSVWLRFIRFSHSTRKTKKSQNGNAQSLFYLLSLALSNADFQLSHANEIVRYYKKSPRGNRDSLDRRRVACVSDVIQVGFLTTSYFGKILLFGDGGQDFLCQADSGV